MTDTIDDEVADSGEVELPDDAGFADFVRMLWDGDLYTTAEKLEVELDLNDTQRALLHDVLVNAVRLVMHQNHQPLDERHLSADAKKLDVSGDKRFAFLRDAFALPDGTFVTWGEATVLDHEARVAMLHKLRDGIERTISKHQSVMAQLVQSKVRCLNDLYSTGGAQ